MLGERLLLTPSWGSEGGELGEDGDGVVSAGHVGLADERKGVQQFLGGGLVG